MLSPIFAFIAVLSVLILIHELGHFLLAKRAGIWVEEFGFGFPPRVFGKKIGETIYSINLLPIGGFVRLHGETSDGKISKPKRAFLNLSSSAKIPIVVGGVVMNLILAIFCFSLVYSFNGIPRESGKVSILGTAPGSPAEIAGLLNGDAIISINQIKVTTTDEFIKLTSDNSGKEINVFVEGADGSQREISLTPRANPPENEGPLGVVVSSSEFYFPPVWQRPFLGAYYGTKDALLWGGMMILGMVEIFLSLFKGLIPAGISGPVGIYALTSQAASFGALAVINFAGILSMNLAILNIFPFPALDGGRLVFILFEGITKKKVSPKFESAIHITGMILILIFLVIITFRDIETLRSSGGISGFLENALR